MKGTERSYAEHCQEQNLERFVDHLRELLRDDPEFLATLNRLLHLDNTAAVHRLMAMPGRREMLKQIIPAARIGLSHAMFIMEDKYTDSNKTGK